MKFAAPYFAFLLFILPVIVLLRIWADTRTQRALHAFAASDRLRKNLLGGASQVWSGIIFSLQILGVTLFIVAVTRPQMGIRDYEELHNSRSIIIAIDTSKSMLAQDMKPNRLERAKLAALELLKNSPHDRVGLIAFAGRSFLQSPLTTDHEALAETIQGLDHTTIPKGGTSLTSAIDLAIKAFTSAAGQQHGLIIFSDGQETDPTTREAARRAKAAKLQILTVGVGTLTGARIPNPELTLDQLQNLPNFSLPDQGPGQVLGHDEYVRDGTGKIVISKLDSQMLRDIAQTTGGTYTDLLSKTLTAEVVTDLLQNLERFKQESQHDSRMIERYQWPLAAGMFCIILSLFMRPTSRKLVKPRPSLPTESQTAVHVPAAPQAVANTAAHPTQLSLWVLLLTLGTLALPSTTQAVTDPALSEVDEKKQEELFQRYEELSRKLQDPKQKLTPKQYQELSYQAGKLAYDLKFFGENTNQAFSDALLSPDADMQLRALRGLASSLYYQGNTSLPREPDYVIQVWEDSLKNYNYALKLKPEDKNLRENRDFVKKRLEDLKKAREEQKRMMEQMRQQQQQQGKGGKEKKKDGAKGNKGDKDQEPGSGGHQDNPEQDADKSDALQEKQAQLPEGQLRAGQAGAPTDDLAQQQNAQNQAMNPQTGFSPIEALKNLRSYADDRKSTQYLMHAERADNGNDY